MCTNNIGACGETPPPRYRAASSILHTRGSVWRISRPRRVFIGSLSERTEQASVKRDRLEESITRRRISRRDKGSFGNADCPAASDAKATAAASSGNCASRKYLVYSRADAKTSDNSLLLKAAADADACKGRAACAPTTDT